jgi:hypothetical protein
VQQVHASDALLDYLQALIAATRSGQWFAEGLSPRAGIAMLRAAKARALMAAARLRGARRRAGHPAADRRAPAGAGGRRRPRARRAGARHGRGRCRHSVIRGRIRRWFENRLPRTDSWVLTQRNIYILPTKAGWGFCVTLLVMLLAPSTTSSTWAMR